MGERRIGPRTVTYVGLAFASLVVGFALGSIWVRGHDNSAVAPLVLVGGAAFILGGLFATTTQFAPFRLSALACSMLGLGVMIAGFYGM